jgi:Zn finger protein HypA/HybF involved in hydrogenase expression
MWDTNRNKGGSVIMTLTIIALIIIVVTVLVLKTLEIVLSASNQEYKNNVEYTCKKCRNYFKLSSDEVILFAVCPNCRNVEGVKWEQ